MSDLKIGRTTSFECFESQVPQSSFAVKNNQTSESVKMFATLPTTDAQEVTELNDHNQRDADVNQKPTLSRVKDCPPVPEIASLHFIPGDDFEPSLMACVGSTKHRKLLEKNKQPDVVKTNPMVRDYLDRLKKKSEIDKKQPKQFDHIANQPRRPQEPNLPTSSSKSNSTEVDRKQPHRSSLKQNAKVLHKTPEDQFVSTSTSSSTSDEPGQRYSSSSKIPNRSARGGSLQKQSTKFNQMAEQW